MLPLDWVCLRFTARCESNVSLDWQWGEGDETSLVRFAAGRLAGDLGRVMKGRSCPFGRRDSPLCATRDVQCLYGTLFRAHRQRAKSGDESVFISEPVPRPLLLDVFDPHHTRFRAGERLAFDVTLVGSSAPSWPLVVAAVLELGECGVGRGVRHGLGRFRLEEVRPLTVARETAFLGSSLFEPNGTRLVGQPQSVGTAALDARAQLLRDHTRLRVRLLRPTRVRDRADDFDFFSLWDSLTTRLQLLCDLYGSAPLVVPYIALKERAREVKTLGRRVRWHKQERVSAPKFPGDARKRVDVSGFVGEMEFEGDFTPFLPLLLAGEWLGVGRHTDLGNGRFRVERVDPATSTP